MSSISDQLPDLLGNALLRPSDPEYTSENETVARIREGIRVDAVTEFVGYAYGEADEDASIHARAVSLGSDDEQEWTAGDQLTRRFVAVALMDLLQNYNGPTVTAVALVAHASIRILRQPVVAELTPSAIAALPRLAEHARAVRLEKPSVQPFPAGKSSALPPDDATPVTSDQLRSHLEEQRTVVRAAADNVGSRLAALETLATRNSEEIDLLWWARSPFSDAVPSWSQGGEQATLVAGLELSRRLLIDPPPRGTELLLSDALRKAGVDPSDRVDLSRVVTEAHDDLLSDFLSQPARIGSGFPVLSALAQHAGGIASDSDNVIATRLEWAQQLVYELSLQRLLNTLGNGGSS